MKVLLVTCGSNRSQHNLFTKKPPATTGGFLWNRFCSRREEIRKAIVFL
jgi:hypothetical protein